MMKQLLSRRSDISLLCGEMECCTGVYPSHQLWEFTAGNLLEPAIMLNTTDEQHTLSQPTKRRANTANGKEGLKHASTLRCIHKT